MQVPRDEHGRPRFSITQFRAYGGVEDRPGSLEPARGCPLQYRLRYVDRTIPPEIRAPGLRLGGLFHDALEHMEAHSVGAEDAISAVWPADLTFSEWVPARRVLADYVEREGPLASHGHLAEEIRLAAVLYVDDAEGPVIFDGILDSVRVDLDADNACHVVDYKGNQQPPTRSEVERDAQGMSQHWLVWQNWARLGFSARPRVIWHLDALRWRDIPHEFSTDDIELWHEWAVTMARRILRDDDPRPVLNEGCPRCPAQPLCPKWQALPGDARGVLARRRGETALELDARRLELEGIRKLLDAEIESVTAALEELVHLHGELVLTRQTWTSVPREANYLDPRDLHAVLGEAFYRAVSISKASIDRATEHHSALRAAALAHIQRVTAGRTIRRRATKQ